MSSDEEVPTCPLCLEDLDATDRAMQPCKCSYVVCCWCLNHIRERLNGLCPACRTPYEEQNFTFKEVSTEAALKEAKERATAKKERERREKLKELERERARAAAVSQQKAKTNLKHARFVQRNLVYVIGLSLTLAREEYLRRADMFGRFGRILRVLVNRAHPYNADAPGGPSISAYIQFARDIDASAAARSMKNVVFDGREIRCSIACTKYCDAFVKNGVHCGNSDCMYIHDVADPEDVLSREDVLARQLGPPPPSHLFVPVRRREQPSVTRNAHGNTGMSRLGDSVSSASASTPALSTSAITLSPSGRNSNATVQPIPEAVAGDDPFHSTDMFSDVPLRSGVPVTTPEGTFVENVKQSSNLCSISSTQTASATKDVIPSALQGASAHGHDSISRSSKAETGDSDDLSPSRKSSSQVHSASQILSVRGWGAEDSTRRSPRHSPNRHVGDRASTFLPADESKQPRKRPSLPTRSGVFSATSIAPPPGFEGHLVPSPKSSVPPPGFSNVNVGSIGLSTQDSLATISKARTSVPPGFEIPSEAQASNSGFRTPRENLLKSSTARDRPWDRRLGDYVIGDVSDSKVRSESPVNATTEVVLAGITSAKVVEVQLTESPVSIPNTDSSDAKADAVFSGRGITLPEMSFNPSQLSSPRPVILGSTSITSVVQVTASPGLRSVAVPVTGLPPELRPSRRKMSRFGFAQTNHSSTTMQDNDEASLNDEFMPSGPFSFSDRTISSKRIFEAPLQGTGRDGGGCGLIERPNITPGVSQSRTVRSRFDFAEKELSPPRHDEPLALPSGVTTFTLKAPKGLDALNAVGSETTNVAFSQLSTQEKLASLFRSAQWSTEGLPPMPTVGDRLRTEPILSLVNSGVQTEHLSGAPDSNFVSPASNSSNPSVSQHGPPGFIEATPECSSATTDSAAATVTPGVAFKFEADGHNLLGSTMPAAGPIQSISPQVVEKYRGSLPALDQVGVPCSMKHPPSEAELIASRSSLYLESFGNGVAGGTSFIQSTVSMYSEAEASLRTSKPGIEQIFLPESSAQAWVDISPSKRSSGSLPEVDLSISEVELERQVQAARAREAQLAAQLSELQQQIRRFDNIRT